jgi:hypothetical protein
MLGKISVCIPVHGDTRALFTYKLARMLLTTERQWASLGRDDRPDIELFMAESSGIARNREHLVGEAERWGAQWILWLDADQTFPPETLLRLISLRRPLVGANYPRREDAPRPTARSVHPDGRVVPAWTTPEKAEAGTLESVTIMGLGVCLVSMEAIRRLERPCFAGDNEDHYFFSKMIAAGVQPVVDHRLSAQVGHIRVQVLTSEHMLATMKSETAKIVIPVGAPVPGKLG